MSEKYPRNFLKNVTARIDFGHNYYEISSAVPGVLQEKIKERFPYMQKKSAMAEQYQVLSETEVNRRHVKENHWFFQAGDGSKTLCLAPNFLWIDYKKYNGYDDLKEALQAAVDGLRECFPDFSANRFGLRYLNEIEMTDPHVTEWGEYLNGNLLSIFNMAEDRSKVSRAFHNLEMNHGDVNLTFLYGMHNPDYPAPIRLKTFILDFDAYATQNQNADQIMENLQLMHDKIEALFEKSITDRFREIIR